MTALGMVAGVAMCILAAFAQDVEVGFMVLGFFLWRLGLEFTRTD